MHKIISRAEARRQRRTRYFTGESCVRGHVTERRVSNRQCVTCARAYYERYIATKPVAKLRAQQIQQLGGKCECCKEAESAFLCIDHIKGGGNQHRKQFSSSSAFWYWMQRELRTKGILVVKQQFRVLCHNCNYAMHFLGHCPHHPVKS